MKRWAGLVVLLYGAVLVLSAGPLILAAFGSVDEADYFLKSYAGMVPPLWPLWTWLAVMVLAEAALLVVPVRLAMGEIVARRHLIWTVLATAAATAVLAAGMLLSVLEYTSNTRDLHGTAAVWLFGAMGVVWLLWSVLFAFYTGRNRPTTPMGRFVRFLVAGSILELLVAVPTHFIARWRNYCCAGFLSFWGLATGFSVLLFAFGPGVLLLFARRWRSLRHRPAPRG